MASDLHSMEPDRPCARYPDDAVSRRRACRTSVGTKLLEIIAAPGCPVHCSGAVGLCCKGEDEVCCGPRFPSDPDSSTCLTNCCGVIGTHAHSCGPGQQCVDPEHELCCEPGGTVCAGGANGPECCPPGGTCCGDFCAPPGSECCATPDAPSRAVACAPGFHCVDPSINLCCAGLASDGVCCPAGLTCCIPPGGTIGCYESSACVR